MSNQFSDPKYLSEQQYRNASNLNARVQLHQRFGTNQYGWHRWVLDQFDLPASGKLLELGCGPGWLWLENRHRVPAGWHITLSDFSFGMLRDAQQKLQASSHRFRFAAVNAQSIPFADEGFGAVIANHMLYHVPDRDEAFSEIQRVLVPGGRFYAATNGASHLRELAELLAQFGVAGFAPSSLSFSLENGFGELSKWFTSVEMRRYEDALEVTESEPLVAYVFSGLFGAAITSEQRWEFSQFVAERIKAHGAIHITKDSGLFVAHKE